MELRSARHRNLLGIHVRQMLWEFYFGVFGVLQAQGLPNNLGLSKCLFYNDSNCI